ncbi:hypothetical protein EKO27_g11797 [Xylaria grammica]|uniref:CFEM domain-containing protein n=1 Tax=Xylaria grammica TaxID=363999 RepID=A0A439CMB2_9PEZI|nr:hypothetical protein EKO27_g11797 [Xylaria grammica]
MDELPVCALICLGRAAVASDCSTGDTACACHNEVFINYVTPCITEACTVREAFFTKNQTAVQCHVNPHVDQRFIPIIISFFILTFIVILLRVASRVVTKVKFWYDDYFNVAGFVAVVVHTFTDVALSKHGLGTDIWAVPQENISTIITFTLVGSCLYLTSRLLVRVSILLFYLRIFTTPGAKAVITWTLAFFVVSGVVALFPLIFQCSPVDYLWLQWDGTHRGHCIDLRLYVWIITSVDIAEDVWAILIACSLVSRLQLPLRKKLMVLFMFTVGVVTVAISIARLPYIDQFTETKNPTIDWIPITIWSALENYIGVICACLPSLPPLLRSLSANKISSDTKKHKNSRPLAFHRMRDDEHELGGSNYALAHRTMPTYRDATCVYQDGSVIPGHSLHMHRDAKDWERQSL